MSRKDSEMKRQALDYWSTARLQSIGKIDFEVEDLGLKKTTQMSIDREDYSKIISITKGNNLTIFILLTSVIKLMLAKLYDNQNFSMGIPQIISEDLAKSNNKYLIFPAEIKEKIDFKTLIAQERERFLELMKHQFYPLDIIYSSNAIYEKINIFCAMEGIHKLEQIQDIQCLSHNEMMFLIRHNPETIDLEIHSHVAIKDSAYLGKVLNGLLQNCIVYPNIPLVEIEMVRIAERRLLIDEFNNTSTFYPKDTSISELFEAQVDKTPENIAISYHSENMSYNFLNESANQLAVYLIKSGVQPDEIVALLLDRSFNMIISILAVLKAGAVYLPIDPTYPEDRIHFILMDSGAGVLIQANKEGQPYDELCRLISLDTPEINLENKKNLCLKQKKGKLAYIMYTSGSTGKPKGTLIEESSVIRIVKNTNYLKIYESDHILQLSSYAFDGSILDIFGSLLNGAKLVLVNKKQLLDSHQLSQLVQREKISIAMITTALFNSLIDTVPETFKSMRKILVGGEKASVRHMRAALEYVGPGKIIHMYGPTESAVFASYYPVDEIQEDEENIAIGKPISNTRLYVLNEKQKLLPIGMIGELFISGDGLSRGYLNLEDLTKEKFIENLYKEGEIIYKTGDLVRWREDGNLEYLQRTDGQVKIRGFRIEFGEIESKLKEIEGILEVVVVVKDVNETKYMYAYYVSNKIYSGEFLRRSLKRNLPDYMIPSKFIHLKQLPLTVNGKIDKILLLKDSFIEAYQENKKNNINNINNSLTERMVIDICEDILKVDGISLIDNFFEIGGHSLNAIKVIGRIQEEMEVDITIERFFSCIDLQDLAVAIDTSANIVNTLIPKAKEKESFEASPAQKRIYLAHEADENKKNYNIIGAVEVIGNIDLSQLESAIWTMIENQEILRTSFHLDHSVVVQKIHKTTDVNFSISVIKDVAEEELYEKVKGLFNPFDLSKPKLMRISLILSKGGRIILHFDIHHIIADGISLNILLKQIALYGEGNSIQFSEIQYKDYSELTNKMITTNQWEAKKTYWMNILKGDIPVLNLPTDYSRPKFQSFIGETKKFYINWDITEEINRVLKKTNTTNYMFFMAVYSVLLAKFSGQEDIIVGSASAGRRYEVLQNVVGMFVNSIAIRNYPDGNKSFLSYLQETKNTCLQAFEHQEYPLENLSDQLYITRETGRNYLFDTMLVMQNIDAINYEFIDVKFKEFELSEHISKFDITLQILESPERFECCFEYSTDLFKPETIDRMISCFQQLLKSIIASLDSPIMHLEILDDDHRNSVIHQFNNTELGYMENMTMHRFFERQVALTPNNIAVTYQNTSLTYKQLNKKSNQLARLLIKRGVSKGKLIGIMLEKSLDLIVSILAVLKTGGAYLPIDPEYPWDRILYIIDNSKLEYILKNKNENDNFPEEVNQIDLSDERRNLELTQNLDEDGDVDQIAYVIYTSGSTGRPKGVAVAHKGIANLKAYFEEIFRVTAEDHILQFASSSFDAAVWEINMALLNGARLYLVEKDIINNLKLFEKFINQHKISIATLPPSYASSLNPSRFGTLRLLITAGSETNQALVDTWKGQLCYVNAYGPTETTVCATAWIYEESEIMGKIIPIGRPISNTQAYILNKYGHPQPIGVKGELCIGGVGVAIGYLNNEELTKEKFIPDIFKKEGFLYKTGDMVKWISNGTIQYLGRMDNQVKVRGYRIELEEIERNIIMMDGVNEVVVIAKKEGTEYLLDCYYTSDRLLTGEEIREKLKLKLPSYMIPSYFIHLVEMPKNQSGKPDRSLLSVKDEILKSLPVENAVTEMEKLLTTIWSQVFVNKKIKIGISDDYFDLGGDSIKSIKILYLLQNHNLHLKMSDIYKYRTIKKLAKMLNTFESINEEPDYTGEFQLLPIQKWLFEYYGANANQFYQSTMLISKVQLEKDIFKSIIQMIQDYHDSLRTKYRSENGEYKGYICGKNYPLGYTEVFIDEGDIHKQIKSHIKKVKTSLNHNQGPMMNVMVFSTKEKDLIYFLIHHLAIDTVSWGILLRDIQLLYQQHQRGESFYLPNKSTPINKWSSRLKEYSNSLTLLDERYYWSKVEVDIDRYRIFHKKQNVKKVKYLDYSHISLSEVDTENLLLQSVKRLKVNVVDILLSALAMTLSDMFHIDRIPLDFEGHGREEVLGEVNLQRTLGWFTSIYPFILQAHQKKDILEYMNRIMLDRKLIPNNGIGYSVLKYLTDDENKKGLFNGGNSQICFNYQGNISEEEDTLFYISEDSEDISKSISYRPYELEFNLSVHQDSMHIDLWYNRNVVKKDVISSILIDYKNNIRKYIGISEVRNPIDKIEDVVSYAMDKFNLPGMIAGVMYSGQKPKIIAAGKAEVSANRDMQKDTSFKIGSISKMFTAALILQLSDEGLLSLNDSLLNYIPEYSTIYNNIDFDKITVKQLLNHTGGISNYIKDKGFIQQLEKVPLKYWEKEELIAYALNTSEFSEDKGWDYSSTGYLILGIIIEKILNCTLEEAIQTRICDQLELRNTKLIDRIELSSDISHCYSTREKVDVTNHGLSIGWAAGGVVSDAEDLLKFLEAFLTGKLFRCIDYLFESFDVSFAFPDNYSVEMGLGVFKVNEFIGHEGHGVGFQNIIYRFRDLYIVIHMNQDSDDAVSEPLQILEEII